MSGEQSLGGSAAFERFVVECDGERLSCVRVVPGAVAGAAGAGAGGHDLGMPSAVVLMHGAGAGSKARLVELMSDCAGRGFPACALDFSGHGDSSGTLGELSLERRFVQARAVVDAVVPADHRLIPVGFSMSGHTVADLAAHYGERVRAIGLCAPAVYAAEAWSVPFAAGFTEIIRAPGSWRRSPALDAFRGVTARAVLATPAVDEVIPEAVTEAIADALGASASRFTRLVFPRADHRLGSWFRANAAARAEFLDAVLAGSPRDPDDEPGFGADHLVY